MTSVNTNIAAMNAYRNLSATNSSLSKSLERLSSGFRINRAGDDAVVGRLPVASEVAAADEESRPLAPKGRHEGPRDVADPETRLTVWKRAQLHGIHFKKSPEERGELRHRNDLRIDPSRFEHELLKDQRKVIGRFDARITAYSEDPAGSNPRLDPSLNLYLPLYSSTINDYLRL